MRLALSTTALDRALSDGDLTQLELLDLCANELLADGVVLDVSHFPRRDPEYVAQVKKFAADLGLTLVAVRDDALSTQESDALVLAAGLGAPYVLTRMPESGMDPVTRYNAALGILARVVAEAKRLNVTIAVRNVPGSLCADAFEMSRLRKEADSAWLTFACDPVTLESHSPADGLDAKIRKHVVLAYRRVDDVTSHGDDPHAGVVLQSLPRFAGFLCLDYGGEESEQSAVARLTSGWRRVLATHEVQAGSESSPGREPRVPS
jgi:sugar phosphate isomerase/epimerase